MSVLTSEQVLALITLVESVEFQFDGPKDGKTIMTGLVGGMWVPKTSPTLG